MESKKKYKFTIAKDKAGNMMLSAFCGEIDKKAIDHAKRVGPVEFAKTLANMIDRAKE